VGRRGGGRCSFVLSLPGRKRGRRKEVAACPPLSSGTAEKKSRKALPRLGERPHLPASSSSASRKKRKNEKKKKAPSSSFLREGREGKEKGPIQLVFS